MVELKVRMSSKGQIVIPKIFRDNYKIYPEQEVVIKADKAGVLIRKQDEDVVEKLKNLAEKINEGKKKKHLTAKQMKEIFYEQYDERAKRAGIKIRN